MFQGLSLSDCGSLYLFPFSGGGSGKPLWLLRVKEVQQEPWRNSSCWLACQAHVQIVFLYSPWLYSQGMSLWIYKNGQTYILSPIFSLTTQLAWVRSSFKFCKLSTSESVKKITSYGLRGQHRVRHSLCVVCISVWGTAYIYVYLYNE